MSFVCRDVGRSAFLSPPPPPLEHNPDLFQLKTAPELLKSPRVSAAIIDAERKRDAQQVAEGPRDAPGLE